MKPVCVPCRLFFRMVKSGFVFTEGMPAGSSAPGAWKPYKIWAGDLWKCPRCGAAILSGVGARAIAEHFEPDFAKKMERYGAGQLQVDDC